MGKFVVRVPASSSYLKADNHAFGVSYQLYLTVIVEEKVRHWTVNHALTGVPHDADNLIVQTIIQIDPRIAPHQLTVMTDIPQIKGMGFKTTSVIAGVKIANALGNLNLSSDDEIHDGQKILGMTQGLISGIQGQKMPTTAANAPMLLLDILKSSGKLTAVEFQTRVAITKRCGLPVPFRNAFGSEILITGDPQKLKHCKEILCHQYSTDRIYFMPEDQHGATARGE